MRAVVVSHEFSDILAVTLPLMRHHFDAVLVVTSPSDLDTITVAVDNTAEVFPTQSFTEKGAYFNKWAALEKALGCWGREGWLCLLDADVIWPREVPGLEDIVPGNLYGMPRRIMDPIRLPVPAESDWGRYPVQQNSLREIPGYTQIFHGADPHLPHPPWHETNWKHAGRADSFFQKCWPRECKLRFPCECLHLGRNGRDWCGRTTPYLDGTVHPDATAHAEQMKEIRRQQVGRGKVPYEDERLGGA